MAIVFVSRSLFIEDYQKILQSSGYARSQDFAMLHENKASLCCRLSKRGGFKSQTKYILIASLLKLRKGQVTHGDTGGPFSLHCASLISGFLFIDWFLRREHESPFSVSFTTDVASCIFADKNAREFYLCHQRSSRHTGGMYGVLLY